MNNDKKVYIDHLGKEYSSQRETANAWEMHQRKIRGESIENCLINPVKLRNRLIKDPIGKIFSIEKSMDKHWGIDYNTYQHRVRKGLNLEECINTKTVSDHLGNNFNTITEMLEYWKMNHRAFYRRKSMELSVEECLTLDRRSGKPTVKKV